MAAKKRAAARKKSAPAKPSRDKKPGKKPAPAPKPKVKVRVKAKADPKAAATPKPVESKKDEPEKKIGFRFPEGNSFWQCRAKHGRNGKWDSPQALLDDCLSYFEWLEDNPLYEEKGFSYQGVVTKEKFCKMRAATLDGLELHLGIVHNTWMNYRKKPDFLHVVELVEKAIRQQKFAGAAADLLNANIISRDLGLADKTEHDFTDRAAALIEARKRVEQRQSA